MSSGISAKGTKFIRYPADKSPLYVFAYNMQPADPIFPIHDHRDNVTGAGFAFSVYHLGTSLPQQPWGL
jgi:hypothetical protein